MRYLLIKASLLDNNLQWMQRFANQHNVKLAPHGKTTITPAFFHQQLEHGAWGITIASPAQAQVAVLSGAKNIIMANQLVGLTNMMIISQLIKHYDVNFYCCVDSKRNIEALEDFFASHKQKLNILIEMGVDGGRCGCRTEQEMMTLAQHIHQSSHLNLKGIEVYEGLFMAITQSKKLETFSIVLLQSPSNYNKNSSFKKYHWLQGLALLGMTLLLNVLISSKS
ncbi:predicted amino acid aldolase or racemase [Photobacterium sp. SKA34]|nr:predicted amino acid aldolase or racemase [Photobacterium sp. SKA34]